MKTVNPIPEPVLSGLFLSPDLQTTLRNQLSLYLAPVVVDVRVVWINLCSHVEILCREHWLLLLHVHASTLN